MAGETFQLRFKNNENVTVSIDEPINFATVDFQLSQKDKGYGRDVSFNGGEVQFEFVKYRNHYLDKLLDYNNTYGFESIVELIITCGTVTTIIGELDFATAITDDLEYFKCKVIQQSSKQIVKRRKAVKVDLLSDRDIDGNEITPLIKENLILISKPIYASSKLEQDDALPKTQGVHSYGSGRRDYKLWSRNLTDYSIETTFNPINDGSENGVNVITASTELRNINIKVSEFTCTYGLYNSSGGGDASGYFGIRWGSTFNDVDAVATEVKIPESIFSFAYGGQTKTYTKSLEVTVPLLLSGQNVWIYHSLYVRHSGGGYSAIDVTQSRMTIDMIAESLAADSVVYSFRLVDVMRQVVKSISGLNIYAPRFDVAGEFYDNRLVNGNFLRKIDTILDKENKLINKAFLISLEDLEKSLVELNVDWEIAEYLVDDVKVPKIFFGIEDDFYTETPIKTFTNTQFSSFNKSFNPKFTINEFHYGYKNFQSLKENEELFSADVIHGESKWVLQNKSVENKKEISVEWIRDAFLIETNRRKAIEVTSDTASREDDSLFIIDSKDTVESLSTDSDTCDHLYDGSTEYLKLVSSGAIITNFEKLPFNVGDIFNIISPTDINIGTYIVKSIETSKLELDRQSDLSPTPSINTFYTRVVTETGATGNYNYTFTHNFTNDILNKTLRLSKSGAIFTESYVEGDIITINTCPINKGKYEIIEVNNIAGNVYLDLKRVTDVSATLAITTNFQYTLNPDVNPFLSYTDESITGISNLVASDKFANLRYSIRRNIEKYWKKYLSTCNLYNRTKTINNTWYKNNKYFTSTNTGLTLTESDPITTGFYTPILTPFIYNDVVFSNVEFADFIQLQDDIRKERGYIKTYDNNGLEILLYPINMKYENLSKELTIKAEEKFTSTFVPTIESKSLSPKSGTTQLSGGNILSDGYSAITAKGVIWDTSANPTIALSTKTNDGTGYATFTSLMSPLVQFTNYYARAYATNGVGVGYGNQINFLGGVTDIVIGTQTWMVENLDVVKYRNGDTIPQVTDPTAWAALTTGAWCWYANSSSNGTTYGKLYNWYAVNDARGLAPVGYHVPTYTELTTLTNYLGGDDLAGGKMKSTTLWNSPNTGATNDSGFTALPASFRGYDGGFVGIGEYFTCWSSSEYNTTDAWYLYLNYGFNYSSRSVFDKKSGFSIRLIKDI
jgi:uncharacterized protein (TIGR02145 family)